MRRIAVLAALSTALFAAGCQTDGPRVERLPVAERPQGIEGSWSSVGGSVAYNANFAGGGRYTATEAGTGAVLAEGTFRSLGPGQVTVDYTSKLRGNRVSANCNQGGNNMVCVLSDGSRYDFVRRI